MLFNLTVFSLLTNFNESVSPLYTIVNAFNQKTHMNLIKSTFLHSLSHIVYAQTEHHSSLFKNNIFRYSLATPIKLIKDDCHSHEFPIKYQIFNDSRIRPIFASDCGNVTIVSCIFVNCNSLSAEEGDGGGLLIAQMCDVILAKSIFYRCISKNNGGGAIICAKEHFIISTYQKEQRCEPLNQLIIHQCCFEECDSSDDGLFGSALVAAAKKFNLTYNIVMKCPAEHVFHGAQIDITCGLFISSCFNNFTFGRSQWCGSIEFRSLRDGIIEYQQIHSINSIFTIALTKIDTNHSTINRCTFYNNTIYQNPETRPSIIYLIGEADYENFVVEQCYFIFNVFRGDGYYIAKSEIETYFRFLNCVITVKSELSLDKQQLYYITNPAELIVNLSSPSYTPPINLSLQFCHFEKTAEPIIITRTFTPSNKFTQSNYFSISSEFSQSFIFSPSIRKTQSIAFSKSDYFSKSKLFSSSSVFTQSNTFSYSNPLTQTNIFTPSNLFTKSDLFTSSNIFTASNEFTELLPFPSPISQFTLYIQFTTLVATQSYKKSHIYFERTMIPTYIYFHSMTYTILQKMSFSISFIHDQFSIISIYTYVATQKEIGTYKQTASVSYRFFEALKRSQDLPALIIIGAVSGVSGGLLLIFVIVFTIYRIVHKTKKTPAIKSLYETDIYTSDDFQSADESDFQSNSLKTNNEVTNPLFHNDPKDDPFAEDFQMD